MNRRSKGAARVFSWLFCAMLVVGLMPSAAFAEVGQNIREGASDAASAETSTQAAASESASASAEDAASSADTASAIGTTAEEPAASQGAQASSGTPTTAASTEVAAPVAAKGLVYTGLEQEGVPESEGYTLTGDAKATNAGSYTATATLADGYVWADGTSNAKVIEWSIAKATLTAKVNSNRKWIMYNKDADGNYALCTLSLSDVTVTGFVNSETAAKASGYVAPTNTVPDEKPVWGNMVEVTPAGGAADNYEFTYESTSLKTGIVSDATGTEGSGKKAPSSSGDGMSAGVYRGTVNLYVPGKYNTVLTNVNAFPSSPNDPMASNTYAISVGCMTAGADGAAPTLPAVENAEFTINDDGTVSMTLEIPNEVFTIQSIESGENITVESYTTKEATYKPMFGTASKPSRIETITVTLKDLSGSYELTNCTEFPTLLGQDWSVPLCVAVDFQSAVKIVDEPTAASGLEYTGAEQVGVAESDDYTLSGDYKATAAGTYTATATLKDGRMWADGTTDAKTFTWSIGKATLTAKPAFADTYSYTGSSQQPAFTVTQGDALLVRDTDYTWDGKYYADESCANAVDVVNAGTYYVKVEGAGSYAGSTSAQFEVAAADISGATIAAAADQTYTGAAVEPALEVTLGGSTLVAGADYTVTYSENTAVGTATATVTGTGNYVGTASVQFSIKGDLTIDDTNPCGKVVFDGESIIRYTGEALTPSFKVTFQGDELVRDTDYTWDGKYYSDLACTQETEVVDAGLYYVKVEGKGSYTGLRKGSIRIYGANLFREGKVTVGDENGWPRYTGSACTAGITVTANGKTLVEGVDYTWDHKYYADLACTQETTATERANSADEKGYYYVKVEGIGNYAGPRKGAFKVRYGSLFQGSIDAIPSRAYQQGVMYAPVPVVTSAAGVKLTEGVDYTYAYYADEKCTKQVKTPTIARNYYVKVTAVDGSDYQGFKKKMFTITAS